MFFSLPPYAGQSPFPTPTLIRWRSHLLSPPLTPCDTVPIPLSSYISLAPPSLSLFLLPTSLRRAVPFPYSYAHPLCLCPNPALTLFPPALLFYSPFPRLSPIAGRSRFPSPPLTPCDTGGPIFPLLLSPVVTLSQSRSHPTAPLNHHPFPSFFSLPPIAAQSPFPTPTLIRWRSHFPSPPLTPCDTVPIPLSSYCSLEPPSLSLFLLPTSLRRAVPFPFSYAHPLCLRPNPALILSSPPVPFHSPFHLLTSLSGLSHSPTHNGGLPCASVLIPLSSFSHLRYCSIHRFLSSPPLQDEARVHGLDEAEHVAVTEEHAEVPVGAPQDEGDTVGVGGADSTAGEAVHEESSPTRVDTSQDEACVHGLDEAAHVAVPEKHAAVPVGAPHDDRDTVGVGGADSTAGEAVHEESTPTRVDAAQRTDGSGRKKRSLPGWPESPSLAELSGSLRYSFDEGQGSRGPRTPPIVSQYMGAFALAGLAAGSGKKELVGGLGGRTCADGRVFKRRKVNEVTPPGDISAHRNGASGRSVEGNVNVQEEGGSIAERGSGGADTDATGGPHADGQFTEERGGMEDVQWDDVSEMFGYDPHPVHGVRPCSETSFLLIQASISSSDRIVDAPADAPADVLADVPTGADQAQPATLGGSCDENINPTEQQLPLGQESVTDAGAREIESTVVGSGSRPCRWQEWGVGKRSHADMLKMATDDMGMDEVVTEVNVGQRWSVHFHHCMVRAATLARDGRPMSAKDVADELALCADHWAGLHAGCDRGVVPPRCVRDKWGEESAIYPPGSQTHIDLKKWLEKHCSEEVMRPYVSGVILQQHLMVKAPATVAPRTTPFSCTTLSPL
ncbi:unnamed protein product [Closterium sp. NIES-64]|nr:unnamed protein product [Closterium sp. NIES-64]